MLDNYHLKHVYVPMPLGEREEWRICRISYDESLYILYNGGRDQIRSGNDFSSSWMWDEWFDALKPTRQQWFRQMRNITATEISKRMEDCCSAPCVVPLAPLQECTACPPERNPNPLPWKIKAQEGINPMATTSTTTAISLSTAPTDASKARAYLLDRYTDEFRYSWHDKRISDLAKKFNINAPKTPESSQELIDAFKNGKVTIDQAKVDKQTAYFKTRELDDCCDDGYECGIDSRYFGLTFTDLPVADRKGYDAAVAAYEAAKQATKDTIMVMDPAEGLKALQALEAWTPTGAAN